MINAHVSERIEVPTVVSQEQVDFYVDNGFLAVPDMLGADELAELKQDIIKLTRGGYPNQTIQPVPDDLNDEEVLSKILAIHQPHYVSPVMEKYTRHTRISGVLSKISGAHLAHWSGNVKCMQSMLFIKPPGYQGQSWHQDEFDTHDDMATGFDGSPQIPVKVKAGSVVFFNGYLLHQSLLNRTQASYRRVLVNHYLSSESLLPWVKTAEGLPGGACGNAPGHPGGRCRSLRLEGPMKNSPRLRPGFTFARPGMTMIERPT